MKIINVSKTTTKTKDENEDERRKRRRKTKTASIEKEQKERRKLIFKTNALVPKQNERREGATVAASHLPSLSWLSHHQAGPAAFFHGVIQTIGKPH
jgi:hypothetical protein